MVFGKNERELPIDRAVSMMRSGMSEKDIVRQLKAEGYSFGEIEKTLMEVLKTGAGQLPAGAELGAPPALPEPLPSRAPEPPMPEPQPAEEQPMPAQQAYTPQYVPPVYSAYPPEPDLQPEAIMEELIESVAEEKFEQFSSSIGRIENAVERLRQEIGAVRQKAESKPAAELPKELNDRLDSMEARIGGLEKAFKQMLPSITENIRAISKLVSKPQGFEPRRLH